MGIGISLILFAFVFIIIAFIVVANAFQKVFLRIIEDKNHQNKILENQLRVEFLKGPKIEYVYPEVLTVGNTSQVTKMVFETQDQRNHVLKQIASDMGQKLLELKLIDFDVKDLPDPTYNNLLSIYSEIKVLNDKRN